MKITMEPTEQLVTIVAGEPHERAEVPARVWVGTTDSGITVQVLVTRIAVDKDDAAAVAQVRARAARAARAARGPSRILVAHATLGANRTTRARASSHRLHVRATGLHFTLYPNER